MRTTKSAELTESSSKQTSTGTPAAISSVPIAPSPHRTDPANSSRKSIGAQSLAATYKWSGAIFIYKRQNSEFRRQNSEGRMRNSEAVASNLEPQRPKRQDAGQLRARSWLRPDGLLLADPLDNLGTAALRTRRGEAKETPCVHLRWRGSNASRNPSPKK